MKTKLKKWGNSLALRIPKSFADEVGLQKEASVDVSVDDGKIVITPTAKLSLDELLERITEDNLHGEFETGPAVGNETW